MTNFLYSYDDEKSVLLGSPAYGRDYDTKEEMRRDFLIGKDFINHTPGVRGKYLNITDAFSLMMADEVILSNRKGTVHVVLTRDYCEGALEVMEDCK